jgi:predicted Fe-Mo cluster-binding NifX family protein
VIVAMPVLNARVSPVFDWSGRLMVVRLDDGREVGRDELSLAGETPAGRVERLGALGVETLLCGAISEPLESLVRAKGIAVISWVCGDAEEVLAAFGRGALPSDRFAMPGCCGQRRRFRRGRACRGQGREKGRCRR